MSAKPALEPALRAFAARERRTLDNHPTPEILVAYRAGELTAGEDEKLRDHLALCPECAEMLLDLVAFEGFTPPEESPGLTDAEIEAAWHRVQPRLAEHSADQLEPPSPSEPLSFRPRSPKVDPVVWRRELRRAYALAAALFVGVVGLSAWTVSLHRAIQKESEPRANPPVADAFSETEGTRSDSPEEAAAPGEDQFILFLHPVIASDVPGIEDYGVEIRKVGASEPPVARLRGLTPSNLGVFSMRLSGRRFPPGLYRVVVYGIHGGRWEHLDTLTFSITSPPGRGAAE